MDRGDLQKLATERVADAKALLSLSRWSAAYYLAGYAVECGLKSCVLARLAGEPELIFEHRRFSENCWAHDLKQLVDLAGLRAALDADKSANPELEENWEVVKDWSELSRYLRRTKAKAQDLYDAITQKRHGVLPWLKAHW